MFRSMLSSLATFLILSGCATVPLASQGPRTAPPVRPINDLMAGRGDLTRPIGKNTATATATTGIGKPTASPKPGQPMTEATIAERLQTAEDSAASALSMSQSAQNADDWSLVAQQWKKAIDLLPAPPAKSALFPKVQQVRNTYTASRQSAQAQASGRSNAVAPIEINPGGSNGRRGFSLGGDPFPSPQPNDKPNDKSNDKPNDKPNDKSSGKSNDKSSGKSSEQPSDKPKNNSSPAPSPKN
jgi:hypothetical protein